MQKLLLCAGIMESQEFEISMDWANPFGPKAEVRGQNLYASVFMGKKKHILHKNSAESYVATAKSPFPMDYSTCLYCFFDFSTMYIEVSKL